MALRSLVPLIASVLTIMLGLMGTAALYCTMREYQTLAWAAFRLVALRDDVSFSYVQTETLNCALSVIHFGLLTLFIWITRDYFKRAIGPFHAIYDWAREKWSTAKLFRFVEQLCGILILGTAISFAVAANELLVISAGGCLANVLYSFGAYEFGEHVYSYCIHDEYSSLAWRVCCLGHDMNSAESDSNKLNDAVAKVYGADSPQMAYRYLRLAFRKSMLRDDHAYAIANIQKAAAIFEAKKDKPAYVKSISYLARENTEMGRMQDALLLAKRAATIESQCEDDEAVNNLETMKYVAWKASDLHFLKQVETQLQSAKRKAATIEPYWWHEFNAILSDAVLLGAYLLFLKWYAGYVHSEWVKEVIKSKSDEEFFAALHKLTTMELALSRLDQADRLSLAMLEVANRL